jgi:hypothetical protein
MIRYKGRELIFTGGFPMPGHFEPPFHRPEWPGHVESYRVEQVAAIEAQIAALEAVQPQTVTTVAEIAALQARSAALQVAPIV